MHKNSTACHLLGNLCALSLHRKDQASCSLVFDFNQRKRLPHVPMLYFEKRMSTSVPREEEITNVYTAGRGQRLNITAVEVRLRLSRICVN